MSQTKAGMAIPRLWALLAAPVIATIALVAPGIAFAGPPTPNQCLSNAIQAEKTYRIPEGLLQAISIQESGVNGKPYPWALNLGGRVVYASNIEAARKILGDRSAKGRKNLYAGCMQLSVKYHGGSFASLGELLQPQRNTAYAGKYLASHFDDYGDWEAAVRRYHGGKPRQSAAYFCKIWRNLAATHPESAKAIDNGRCGSLPDTYEAEIEAEAEDDAADGTPAYRLEEQVPTQLSHLDRRELS